MVTGRCIFACPDVIPAPSPLQAENASLIYHLTNGTKCVTLSQVLLTWLPPAPPSFSQYFLTHTRSDFIAPLFSGAYALFGVHQIRNPFVPKRFQTLCQKHPG